MVYMGSKSRYAKDIVPILQRCIDENELTKYFEFFVGGANIIDKINCPSRTGFDKSTYLVDLLVKASEAYPQLLKLTGEVSKAMWDTVRDNKASYPDWYVGYISYMASYCAGGFPRGYGRSGSDKHCISREHWANFKKQIPVLKGIKFAYFDFLGDDFSFPYELENACIYLDPPYKNTKKYFAGKFDYDLFYTRVRELAKKNFVYISEQEMPSDFKIVWEKHVLRNLWSSRKEDGIKEAVERLFVIGKSLEYENNRQFL